MSNSIWLCTAHYDLSSFWLDKTTRVVSYHNGGLFFDEIDYSAQTADIETADDFQLRARIIALLYRDNWPLRNSCGYRFGLKQSKTTRQLLIHIEHEIDLLTQNDLYHDVEG